MAFATKINFVPPYLLAGGLMLVGAGGILVPRFVEDLVNPATSLRLEHRNQLVNEIVRGDPALHLAKALNVLQTDIALIKSQQELIKNSVDLIRALGMVMVVFAAALFVWTRRMAKRIAPPSDTTAKTHIPIEP